MRAWHKKRQCDMVTCSFGRASHMLQQCPAGPKADADSDLEFLEPGLKPASNRHAAAGARLYHVPTSGATIPKLQGLLCRTPSRCSFRADGELRRSGEFWACCAMARSICTMACAGCGDISSSGDRLLHGRRRIDGRPLWGNKAKLN